MSVPLAVSVVIPTTGEATELPAILTALLADDAVAEVLIVDDRPGGAPLELSGDVRVRVIVSGAVGPGPARQMGVEAATAPLVLLLDHDVVPGPGLAAAHAARHAQRDGLLVVGPMPVDPTPRAGHDPFPVVLYAADYARRTAAYARDADDVLAHLWAGNVSLRTRDARRVGLASPSFAGRRHEDQEFGWRCRAAGLIGVWAPELAAGHRYRRSPTAFFADARAQGTERADLHRVWAADVGPLDPAEFAEGLPAPIRHIVTLAVHRPAASILRALLAAGIAVAGALRAGHAELLLAQLRRRVEQVDAAAQRLSQSTLDG